LIIEFQFEFSSKVIDASDLQDKNIVREGLEQMQEVEWMPNHSLEMQIS
jgi:hypothetical protein